MEIKNNIPQSIKNKIGRNLHNQKDHPICLIKQHILEFFKSLPEEYKFYDNLSPYVSIEDNFDRLLIPKDHPSRSASDTYYVDNKTVLRTHTSAHQNELLAKGETNFLVVGDVYRKDEVDRSHFPVFTQIEGVALVKDDSKKELLQLLSNLVEYLFPGCKYRINDDYFPFTHPSFEFEVDFNGKWLEILGCGIMRREISEANGYHGKDFMAFGIGLDRLAMVLFNIPDIRYLWSTHDRFLNQFKGKPIDQIKFIPYSELPNSTQDIAFWIPSNSLRNNTWLQENDFFEYVRDIGEEWIEMIELRDEFTHPITGKSSRMYRITYSPNDPGLKDPAEFEKVISLLQNKIRENIMSSIGVELR